MATILEAGCIVGGYRILGLRATGGMARVYRAEQLATGRKVAVKLVTEPRLVDGLTRERAALVAIASPNVIGYVGDGSTSTGMYIVVDWIDGEDLRTIIARCPLAIDEAVRIATELCTGLAAVHAAGYVHRDVKPSNVMIDRDGHAMLLDFGLAQPVGAERTTSFGTAAYLAPELIGRRTNVDPRADLYAVGCVLYECLAGVPPFGAESVAQTLLCGLLEPTPRLRGLRPDAPAWLEAIVALLLRKLPEERPRTCAEVLMRLRDRGDAAPLADPSGDAGAHTSARAFAFVRFGDRGRTQTVDLAPAAIDDVVSICSEYSVRVDAPLELLVLTAGDVDPRDQLRRLLGASLGISTHRPDARIAIVTGAGVMSHAISRAHALLESVPAGTVYSDDETRRLAPGAAPLAPCVGRADVVARLRATLEATGFAIVLGEAGIGKTTVVQAVRGAMEGRVPSVLEGRLHLTGATYHAVRAWLGGWLARAGVFDEAGLRTELVRLVGRRGALRARELGRLLGFSVEHEAEPARSREAIEAAIVDVMSTLLAGSTLIVDDAQWLDVASVAVLRRLLDRADRPAIVLAARSELRASFPDLVARATLVEDLRPLDPDACIDLVAHIAPGLDPATTAAIVRDAEGHPLVLLELAHAVVAGATDRTPATAIGLVQARLLRLSPPAKRALAIAAVIGGRISCGMLVRQFDAPDAGAAVAELCAAAVLSRDEDSVSLHFATALVEEAAYDLVPERDRRALHAAIARDVARDVDTSASFEPAVLLRHATLARDPEMQTRAHVLTAERAALLFDFDASREAAQDGIASGATGEQLGRLRLCEAEALLMAERYAEAEVRAREALELVPAGSLQSCLGYWIRTRAMHRGLEPSRARVIFDEIAVVTAVDGRAQRLLLQSLIAIPGNLILIGLIDEVEAMSATVETIASEHAITDDVAAALCRLRARRAQAAGDWDCYRAEFERAAELHERTGNVPEAVLSRLNVAHAWHELGDCRRAIAVTRDAVDDATALELPYALGYGRFLLGCFLRRGGDPDAGRAELYRALEGADEDPRRLGEISVELALDAAERGAFEMAAHHAGRAAELLAPAPTHAAQTCATRSIVHLLANEPAAALAWAERASEAAMALGVFVEDLSLVHSAVLEAYAATGHARTLERARAALAELDERERRVGSAHAATFRARADHLRLRELATALTRG